MKTNNTRRPNILLCVFDSLAARETAVTSSSKALPTLVGLQKRSTVFTAAYTSCPESSPARASLFTGLDPSVHGVWTNGVELPAHEKTFMQLLTQSGYSSWLVGRRQIAGVSNWTTEHSRTEEFTRMEWAHGPLHRSRQNAYLIWLKEKAPQQYEKIFPLQANPDNTVVPPEQYTAIAALPNELSFNHWVGERICSLMFTHHQEQPAQPFLAVAAFSVGASMGVTQVPSDDHEELNEHALQQADTALGRMLAQLTENNDVETVVIVTAGRGNATSGDPHSSMHERSINVPLIISGVNQVPQMINEPVSTIDVAPTLLDIADIPKRSRVQGTSLLNTAKPPRSWAMSRLRRSKKNDSPDTKYNLQTALRANNLKLIVNHGNTQGGDQISYRLFDLASDPEEKNDLAPQQSYAADLEHMIDLMIDARCALEDRTEPRIAKF